MQQHQLTLRHCMNRDHNQQSIVMRCTFKGCNNSQKWMCLSCLNLHDDHVKHCLQIEEFAKLLKVDDARKYIFKQRKQLQSAILQELNRQKEILIQCFQTIEESYLDQFTLQQNEENEIQQLYSRVLTENPLALTEKEIADIQNKQNTLEARSFQESQTHIFSYLRTFNSNLNSITYSLQRFVHQNNGTVTEQLLNNTINYQTVGKKSCGLQFGLWKIFNANGETIGGGEYNLNGKKQGQWVDIEQSSQYSLPYVKHIGNYQDGRRMDHWDIKNADGKILGGGTYSQLGNKHGQWIDVELSQKYGPSYIQYVGKYHEGQRIDQWEIKHPEDVTIGGGQYNLNGKKQGQWADIEFVSAYGHKYIQHIGKYHDNVMVERWEIKDPQGRKIGGGSYNTQGNKDGQWTDVELDAKNGFYYVQLFGIYNDGKRIEQWKIKNPLGQIIEQISYNLDGQIIKTSSK